MDCDRIKTVYLNQLSSTDTYDYICKNREIGVFLPENCLNIINGDIVDLCCFDELNNFMSMISFKGSLKVRLPTLDIFELIGKSVSFISNAENYWCTYEGVTAQLCVLINIDTNYCDIVSIIVTGKSIQPSMMNFITNNIFISDENKSKIMNK